MEREVITQRAHGIDISHYQVERNKPPMADVKYMPDRTWGQVDFVIVKVGEGLNTPYSLGIMGDDYDFNLMWDGASTFDIRGWYFYQRGGSTYSWEAQASKVVDFYNKVKIKPHMIWLDLEKGNNVINKSLLSDTKKILDYWKQKLPDVTIGLYCNPDVINNYLIPIGTSNYGKAWVDSVMAYPQWLAQYYFIKDPNRQPLTYKNYPNWDLWQYRDGGDSDRYINGYRERHYGSPDLNVYNGTVSEMKAWLKISDAVIPDNATDTGEVNMTDIYKGSVVVSSLNIRQTMDSSIPSLGKVYLGDKVEASSVTNGWWKLTKIIRNNVQVALPGDSCYAFQGDSNGYIKLDSFTPGTTDTDTGTGTDKDTIEVIVNGATVYKNF